MYRSSISALDTEVQVGWLEEKNWKYHYVWLAELSLDLYLFLRTSFLYYFEL